MSVFALLFMKHIHFFGICVNQDKSMESRYLTSHSSVTLLNAAKLISGVGIIIEVYEVINLRWGGGSRG